jgi:hypothetical protein
MRLIVSLMLLAVVAGFLAHGSLAALSQLRIRWAGLAIVGLVMQVVLPPGSWPLILLLCSFLLLGIFALRNIELAGFPAIGVGIALNLLVIAVNQGMPVTAAAIRASGQADTLQALVAERAPKHHLAGPDDQLLFLGDVMGLPQPVGQAISVGDLFTYGGVAWLVFAGMTGRTRSIVGRRRSRRREVAIGPQEAGSGG